MGVKHTVDLTRQDAERRYVDAFVKLKNRERREKLERRLDDAPHVSIPYVHNSTENDTLGDLTQKSLHEAYIAVDLAMRLEKYRQQARYAMIEMSDTELENDLERVHDAANGGEGFENYTIVPEDHLADEL